MTVQTIYRKIRKHWGCVMRWWAIENVTCNNRLCAVYIVTLQRLWLMLLQLEFINWSISIYTHEIAHRVQLQPMVYSLITSSNILLACDWIEFLQEKVIIDVLLSLPTVMEFQSVGGPAWLSLPRWPLSPLFTCTVFEAVYPSVTVAMTVTDDTPTTP